MTKHQKKRVFQEFDSLDQGLKDRIKNKYPYGFENALLSYINVNGDKVTFLPFETEDTFYMLRVSEIHAKKVTRGLRHHWRRHEFRKSILPGEF
jgi:hypothetical protein